MGSLTTVYAQKSIEETLSGECKSALNRRISLFSSLNDLVNPGSNLPFVPAPCGKNTKGETSAIPVTYFPFVLLNVYKFLISLALYLFTLGIIVNGIAMQADVFQGNIEYAGKIKKYFSTAISGLLTVLFAYFIVYIILWVFNADKILSTPIIGLFI